MNSLWEDWDGVFAAIGVWFSYLLAVMWHFSLLSFFPERAGRKQKGRKATPSEEPWTRTTKQSFLFPPSNKAVGTTHPNYISATCHERHSRVAKINHIQKPECWAVVTRYCQLVYLHREAKRLPQSNRCWWASPDSALPRARMLCATHNFLNKLIDPVTQSLAALALNFPSGLAVLMAGIKHTLEGKSWRITKGGTATQNTDGITAMHRYIIEVIWEKLTILMPTRTPIPPSRTASPSRGLSPGSIAGKPGTTWAHRLMSPECHVGDVPSPGPGTSQRPDVPAEMLWYPARILTCAAAASPGPLCAPAVLPVLRGEKGRVDSARGAQAPTQPRTSPGCLLPGQPHIPIGGELRPGTPRRQRWKRRAAG